MKNPRIVFTCIVLTLMVSLPNFVKAQNDFAIIVNRDVQATQLDTEELRRIYFGFQAKWNDSKKIRVSYTDFQNEELWKLLNTNESNYIQFWRKREHSGNGELPVIMSNGLSIIDYVANTEGAIGIIQRSLLEEIGDSCKLLTIAD